MQDKPLNPKRLAFCREYMIDSNGTQAAIRAGYSKHTASTQADQLLHILEVKQEISRLGAKVRDKCVANREERQQFWTDTMNGEGNMSDRLRASELLGKSEADFMDVTLTATDKPVSITTEQAERYRAMADAATAEQVSKPHLSKETA